MKWLHTDAVARARARGGGEDQTDAVASGGKLRQRGTEHLRIKNPVSLDTTGLFMLASNGGGGGL